MESGILSRRTLVCYSGGSVALTVIYGFCGMYLLKFYTDVVGVDPRLVGYAFGVWLLLDALSDPVMGYISDRHRFRQGRRRPYFIAGIVPSVLLLWMLMSPPALSERGSFIYLIVLSSLLFVTLGALGIPYGALAFELTSNYNQRSRISGYKNFAELGATTIMTFSIPLLLKLADGDDPATSWSRAQCYGIAAFILGVIAVAGTLMAYYGTREPDLPAARFQFHFIEGFRAAFTNRPFAILLLTFALVTIADRITIAQFFILLEHFHGIREEHAMPVLSAQLIGGLASIGVWLWLGKRMGKKPAMLLATCVWPLTYVALVATRWSTPALIGIFFLMGAFNTGVLVLLGAMAFDVIEWDEARSGRRREGMYVAIAHLTWKGGLAICFVLVGQAMHWIGYRGGQTPTPDVVDGLRLTFASLPVVLIALAGAIFCRYPITKESHEATLREIRARWDEPQLQVRPGAIQLETTHQLQR